MGFDLPPAATLGGQLAVVVATGGGWRPAVGGGAWLAVDSKRPLGGRICASQLD
jgi:hypothetical protein